ncbi:MULTISPECIES: hypothetical protein [unclassified Streptomyces]|uniref:hypothetical protein n=1 Tax=unclassified Streptomyces TaxID=2593676 RepID=UPI0036504114
MRVDVVDGISQEPGEAIDVTGVEGELVALADHDLQRGPGRGSAQFVPASRRSTPSPEHRARAHSMNPGRRFHSSWPWLGY